MKRFIRSDESFDFIREHQNKPEGGYLYIFKHGIGPGTLPKDVEVIKTKDLPNGYTAVWTDRFLTTKEMDQYDIPYETEINRYLERIGYCQKSGDVVPCDAVEASTNPTMKYADKVKFEDIYPTDHGIDFFFTSDDAAYAKEVLGEAGDVEGLVGFSIEVSLPKKYKGNWQEALIYISPKTSDGSGGESDSDWTDITFEISDEDMKSLVEQSWNEYKNWDNPDSEITSSTKYSADMCNITGASNSLVYKNYGDENFADMGNLVAEDPNRPGCYYVIICNPVQDSESDEWFICEEYVDTSDTWFDLDEVAEWAGDSVREDPAELAVCIIDYYGAQSAQGWQKYSSKEAEEFLNNLNVEGKIYWDASV